jgi:hypothetical protein
MKLTPRERAAGWAFAVFGVAVILFVAAAVLSAMFGDSR